MTQKICCRTKRLQVSIAKKLNFTKFMYTSPDSCTPRQIHVHYTRFMYTSPDPRTLHQIHVHFTRLMYTRLWKKVRNLYKQALNKGHFIHKVALKQAQVIIKGNHRHAWRQRITRRYATHPIRVVERKKKKKKCLQRHHDRH